MIAALDADYRGDFAVAGAVVIADWGVEEVVLEERAQVDRVAPYEAGRFAERELPALLAIWDVLRRSGVTRERREGFSLSDTGDRRSGRSLPRIHTVIVDGYVWLDGNDSPGLGGHLWEHLERRVRVIGVAKNRLRGTASASEVLRGSSANPLFVTAAGMDVEAAAARIEGLEGEHRIPTLFRRVDRLCRQE